MDDAVGYLLALVDDSKQNSYDIDPRSSHVQQFNREYEAVDASGITEEHGRPRLEEACRGVIENIKFFDEMSSVGRIMMERFGCAQAMSVITILGKPNEPVNRRSTLRHLVLALFKLDKTCEDLSLHSNAPSSNPTLRDAIEYLLAYLRSRLTVDQVFMPGLLREACRAVTDELRLTFAIGTKNVGEILSKVRKGNY